MADLIRAHDWSATPVGPIEHWPHSLKTAVGLVVASQVPMTLLWGPDGLLIYNEGYAEIGGARHPFILGRPVAECWPEAADFNISAFTCRILLSFRRLGQVAARRAESNSVERMCV